MSIFYYFLANIPYFCCFATFFPYNFISHIFVMLLFEGFEGYFASQVESLGFDLRSNLFFWPKFCLFWLGERQMMTDVRFLHALLGRLGSPGSVLTMWLTADHASSHVFCLLRRFRGFQKERNSFK